MDLKTLESIKSKLKKEMDLRQGKNNGQFKYEIAVCSETGCKSCNSEELLSAIKQKIKENHLEKTVKAIGVGCFGMCAQGPIMCIYPQGVVYCKVNLETLNQIFNEHILNDKICDAFLLKNEDGTIAKTLNDYNFSKNQYLFARKNSTLLSFENSLYDYIALDGYKALYKVLTTLKPKDVINIIAESGLRGRGGAGFPTAKKWEIARNNKGKTKYFCCNADEGDPGAFMDRSLIEGNPHAIIEAMAIGAYAIGAKNGVIYLRAEYPLAGQRLEQAINDAKQNGLLGKNIFGSKFSFDLTIKYGAGAFVCGEETALIKSIEGKRGEPKLKPPYPAESGLYSCPTVINNVETLACVPKIILNGAKNFAKIGTENSKGTKVFALTGKIKNSGLIELPIGSSINDIVYKIGGGILNNKKFKAVQMGGPSGGCVPASLGDTKIDYESLNAVGSMMGSGGMIVMDEDTCMVDIAKFFLEFSVDESCGKCNPCRLGNKKMLDILNKICAGKANLKDLQELEDLASYTKNNSLCGLGQCSPNPVLSTLRYFKDEYIEHIVNKHCPAGVCKNLIEYNIDKEKCVGCSVCFKRCPVGAITGNPKDKFVIDQNKCIKCGLCFNGCKFNAIRRK